MSDDRTVEAALAIKRYVEGLRAELALLGAAESEDLATEVRDMLQDAAWTDPARAFEEIARLGDPAALAGSLLTERGLSPRHAMPMAAWWRMGVAAAIDVGLGLSAPAILLLATLGIGPASTWETLPLVVAAIAAATLAWLAWSPWRNGGPSASLGMAITRVAVVSMGDTRTIVPMGDLAAVGIAVPSPWGVPAAASVLSLALAVVVAFWR